MAENINASLNETLSRSLNTSIATLLSLVGIIVFGTGQIWAFAVAMALGIVIATVSSTYVATYTVVMFERWKTARQAKISASAVAKPH